MTPSSRFATTRTDSSLIAAYDYRLPPDRIAQEPIEPRAAARLLVSLDAAQPPVHAIVADLPDLLDAGDVVVVNETRVLRARLRLRKATGGAAEVLLLEPLGHEVDASGGEAGPRETSAPSGDGLDRSAPPGVEPSAPSGVDRSGREAATWRALVRPGRRLPPGTVLLDDDGVAVVEVGDEIPGADDGSRVVRLFGSPDDHGTVPLPPYIHRPLSNPERYQTVYSRTPGSVAAPTAGLHLTAEVLDRLAGNGIDVHRVDLAVGIDTFRPVTADRLDDHHMHSERYRVPPETLDACRRATGRVVAIGTTTVRALESAAAPDGKLEGRTELFIRPGYGFRVVDALLTNFHMPRSSLLVLLAAFAGDPRWRELYATALAEGYRFLSFGDAMLVSRATGT